MSGLMRNVLTLLAALLEYGTAGARHVIVTKFWVTPFDAGIKLLKSDKYLQFAESAQLDYLVKVGQILALLRSGTSFVNVAQLVKFSRPIAVFSRVRVETRLIYADEKCAYFSHVMLARGSRAAEVLVKMKFKRGHLTVPPAAFLAFEFSEIPLKVRSWEPALEAL